MNPKEEEVGHHTKEDSTTTLAEATRREEVGTTTAVSTSIPVALPHDSHVPQDVTPDRTNMHTTASLARSTDDIASVPSSSSSLVVVSTSSSTSLSTSSHVAGVCPVKAEYLRTSSTTVKIILDGEGRTRGMNKAADREHSILVPGTEKPEWEGEVNFFSGEILRKIKEALRHGKQQEGSPHSQKKKKNGEKRGEVAPPLTSLSTVETTIETTTIAPPPPPLTVAVGQKRKREETKEEPVPQDEGRGAAEQPKGDPPHCRVEPTTSTTTTAAPLSSNTITLVENTKNSSSPAVMGMLSYLPPPEPADFSVRSWEEQPPMTHATGGNHGSDAEDDLHRDTPVSREAAPFLVAPPLPPSGRAIQGTEAQRERGDRSAADDEGQDATPGGDQKWKRLPWLSPSGVERNSSPSLPLVLAPLTTVGNLPFRRICKEFGADVTISEMAVVYNLHRTQRSEWSLLRRHQDETIFGVQLAVSNPVEAKHVAMALEASGYRYDFLDINGGCPIDPINATGCGCALLERRRNSRLPDVIHSLAAYQSQPVTLKCRIGADEQHPTLHQDIPVYQGFPLAGLTIHGRSRRQRYTKAADWEYVEKCAAIATSSSFSSSFSTDRASILCSSRSHTEPHPLPVIGNGDILGWEDVAAHREACPHVSGFMIGRGALIKPWIFKEIRSEQVIDMSGTERLEMLKKFCAYGLSHWGSDVRGVMTTRRFLCEWLSFLHRYVPAGILERLPQKMNERPPLYQGRDEVETMMSSPSVGDWIALSELLLGPVEPSFRFTPKHKSNSYVNATVEGGLSPTVSQGIEEEDGQG